MKSNEILTALNLPGLTDYKKFGAKLANIASLIKELQKLDSFTFEVGPVITNTDLQDKVTAYENSPRFPRKPAYMGAPCNVDKDIASSENIIKTFTAYQSITVSHGNRESAVYGTGAYGTYTFDIPANNAYCDYLFTLLGYRAITVAPVKANHYYHATLTPAAIAKIKNALQYISTDILRPAMTGTLLQFTRDNVAIVATDSHRLYAASEVCVSSSKKEKKFIIPADICKKLAAYKGTGDITLTVGRGHKFVSETYTKFTRGVEKQVTNIHVENWLTCNFTGTNLDITCIPIGAKFPDYQAVIPLRQDQYNNVVMDRKTLLQHIGINLPAANKITKQVTFKFNGKVSVECCDTDFSYESATDFPYKDNTKMMDHILRIAFQGNVLTQILKEMKGPEVTFATSVNTRGVLICDNTNDTRLLMPIYIGE